MHGNYYLINDANAWAHRCPKINLFYKATTVALAALDLDWDEKHIREHIDEMPRICGLFSLIDSHSCKTNSLLHKLHWHLLGKCWFYILHFQTGCFGDKSVSFRCKLSYHPKKNNYWKWRRIGIYTLLFYYRKKDECKVCLTKPNSTCNDAIYCPQTYTRIWH